MAPLNEQVDEVQLIQACTSEGEFQWRGSETDARAWQALLAGESNTNTEGAPSLAFSLRLSQETPLWLNVDYPRQPCDQVQMILQGPQVARHDLDRIKRVIQQRHSAAAREGEWRERGGKGRACEADATAQVLSTSCLMSIPLSRPTWRKSLSVSDNPARCQR